MATAPEIAIAQLEIEPETELDGWLRLEEQVRQCGSQDELSFVLANDTHRVVPFYQSAVWTLDWRGSVDVAAVSGVTALDRNATALRDVRKVLRAIARLHLDGMPTLIDSAELPERLRERWEAYFPRYGYWQTLRDQNLRVTGGLLLTREHLFNADECERVAALAGLVDRQQHWISAKPRWRPSLSNIGHRRLAIGAGLLALLLLLVRVPTTVVGQAEVIPVDPIVIAAPVDGVVEQFGVKPNAPVEVDAVLFEFRDAELRSEVALARKTLLVAVADVERARRRALTDQREGQEVERFRLIAEQKRAELEFAQSRLERAQVRAPAAGVALFSDPKNWIGRPVTIGERVMSIADPATTRLQIWMPVSDAGALEPGSDVRLFLDADPGTAVAATLESTSFAPEESPRGVLSLRIEAALNDPDAPVRLGATGVARVYGDRVSLLYYLVRRPLARLRQFVGL